MTKIPFLRGFSLEWREKFLNSRVSTGTAWLQKESGWRLTRFQGKLSSSEKESDQRLAQFQEAQVHRNSLVPRRIQTEGRMNTHRKDEAPPKWNLESSETQRQQSLWSRRKQTLKLRGRQASSKPSGLSSYEHLFTRQPRAAGFLRMPLQARFLGATASGATHPAELRLSV